MREETLYKALCSVAAGTFQPTDWAVWWGSRTRQLQEILTPAEFRRINITPDRLTTYTWMLSCQRAVEEVLTARKVPFQHGTYYEECAAEYESGRN